MAKRKIDLAAWPTWLAVAGLVLLVAVPRLVALNQYLIVDESDRWLWTEEFTQALAQGNLAGTLVGHGYPGILPVLASSLWVLIEAARRSLAEGQWVGQPGLYLIFHEWSRPAFLFQQRLPIAWLNTGLALAVIGLTWRLFGRRAGLLSGLLIALDPFYLSDSRVNRAEAVITALMTLSILTLVLYDRRRRFRYVLLSGALGGLAALTKIQALTMLPAVALIGLLIHGDMLPWQKGAGRGGWTALVRLGLGWAAGAALAWTLPWPAMWVVPLETLAQVYDYATHMAGAEGAALFFMGRIYEDTDPGVIFYPVVLLFRLTPLALFGLAGLGWAWWRKLTALIPPALLLSPPRLIIPHNSGNSWEGREAELPPQRGGLRGGETRPTLNPRAEVNLDFALTPTPLPQGEGLLAKALKELTRLMGKDKPPRGETSEPGLAPETWRGVLILAAYVLAYSLVMTFGSHKQDRYLMPIFLAVDILAAAGLAYLGGWLRNWLAHSQWMGLANRPAWLAWGVAALVVAGQAAVVLPHHPYYYSYFNPLLGGGQAAVRVLRVGWGEGMDQVGAYLAAKPDSRALTVSSRFTHNMLGFKGELISLTPDYRWTQADYIVLYIQQVQRHQEPSPGFINYFQGRAPEKVIRLGDIDYAWIYPIPFTTPADPRASRVPGQVTLLGYSWEGNEAANGELATGERRVEGGLALNEARIRLLWENVGLPAEQQIVARLTGAGTPTAWSACTPDPAFVALAGTPGAYVESRCVPDLAGLPPGLYTVEFGLAAGSPAAGVEPIPLPAGRLSIRLGGEAGLVELAEADRLEAIARAEVPGEARWLDRVYEARLKLVAYRLEPAAPRPGEPLELTLYWQAVKDVKFFTPSSNAQSWQTDYWQPEKETVRPIHLVVQMADSRSISLGRTDSELAVAGWLPGQVKATTHRFDLAPDLDTPLAVQVEVNLFDEAEVPVAASTVAGQPLDGIVDHLTVDPPAWPDLASQPGLHPVEAGWSNGLALRGYTVTPQPARPGETLQVNLFWEAGQQVADSYVAFVHLLDPAGQIKTQNDSLPRAGAYPVPWWQPGRLVADPHPLTLPPDLPAGQYTLVAGLYRPEDGARPSLTNGQDSVTLGTVAVAP